MPKYKVVGNHRVDGVEPGETLEIDDPAVAARLIAGGHIAAVSNTNKKADPDTATSEGDDS